MTRSLFAIAADLTRLSPPEKLRLAADLFESRRPCDDRLADSLARRAIEEQALISARRDLAARQAIERQQALQAGEPVA